MGRVKRLYQGLQMPLLPELVDAHLIPSEENLRAQAFLSCEQTVLGGQLPDETCPKCGALLRPPYQVCGTCQWDSTPVVKADPLALNCEGNAAIVPPPAEFEKTVLGGNQSVMLQEANPLALNFESKACGWIGWKESKRERKKRDPWICRQAWLYWEEPGGKKRSRYIPKGKLAAVMESVYEARRPLAETLSLLEKTVEV